MCIANFDSATQRSTLRKEPSLSLGRRYDWAKWYVLVYLCLLVSHDYCYCVFSKIVRNYLLPFRLYTEELEEFNEIIEPHENISSSGNETEDVEMSFTVRKNVTLVCVWWTVSISS
jgi:hypothetical protein